MERLPTTAGGAEFERFRAALALKESAGNPSAIQWDTKARGLFQFIPRWHGDWIKEETGRDLDSFLPTDSSPEEMARATKEQNEILFPKYYERELSPFIQKMRKSGAAGGYSDAELGAMAHFAGAAGAETFLRTGKDSTLGTKGNSAGGIPEYVRQFGKNYSANPAATAEAAAVGAQHYGEYGLGRGVYETLKDKDLAYTRENEKARNQAIRALYNASPVPQFSAEQRDKSKEPVFRRQSGGTPLVNVLAAPAEVLLQENQDCLAKMNALARQINASAGSLVTEFEYLERLRNEGRGVA